MTNDILEKNIESCKERVRELRNRRLTLVKTATEYGYREDKARVELRQLQSQLQAAQENAQDDDVLYDDVLSKESECYQYKYGVRETLLGNTEHHSCGPLFVLVEGGAVARVYIKGRLVYDHAKKD